MTYAELTRKYMLKEITKKNMSMEKKTLFVCYLIYTKSL